MTQPAVTQHIQYLEKYYDCKLFYYKNKKLELTEQGETLRQLLSRVMSDVSHFKKNIQHPDRRNKMIRFGATLSWLFPLGLAMRWGRSCHR